MKEFDNYLSQFYEEGSAAENLPASKRVFTESEMQTALSRALLQHGIHAHLEGEPDGPAEGPIDETHLDERCPDQDYYMPNGEARFFNVPIGQCGFAPAPEEVKPCKTE